MFSNCQLKVSREEKLSVSMAVLVEGELLAGEDLVLVFDILGYVDVSRVIGAIAGSVPR